ncbi:MAG: CRISPR-associated endonuclease Cas1, partial [Calditrichaeota bacterium]
GHALMAALEVVGLDPYLGYFHTEKYGRPALALDLVEEFRTPVVDSLVLNIINHRILRPKHFKAPTAQGGIYLTQRGLHIFLKQFSAKLESQVTVRQIGRPLSYRKLFEVQARKITHLIQGKSTAYQPFQMR